MKAAMTTRTDSIVPTDSLSLFTRESCFRPQKEVTQQTGNTSTASIQPYSFPYAPIQKRDDLPANTLFTVLFLILFAILRLHGKDILVPMLQISISRKKTTLLLNEGRIEQVGFYLLGLALSFSVLSVFLSYWCTGEFVSLFALFVFGGLLLYHGCLNGLIRLLGWTFNRKNAIAEAIIQVWAFHISAGLFIAPLVLALFFVQKYAITALLGTCMTILALVLIAKIIRTVIILFSHKVSILDMILYLCALEMIPLLTLWKVMGQNA